MYTIRKARWYVAGKEWKIDSVEVKSFTFVHIAWLKAYLHCLDECEIKIVCQMISFVSFLNTQLGLIYLFEII